MKDRYFKVGKLYRSWNAFVFVLSHRGFSFVYISGEEGDVNVMEHEVVDILDLDGDVVKHMTMTPKLWEEVG